MPCNFYLKFHLSAGSPKGDLDFEVDRQNIFLIDFYVKSPRFI